MKLLACLCLISLGTNHCVNDTEFKLELVQAYFRHGSRTPGKIELYPKSPYKDEHFNNLGYNQLTQNGKKMMYDLGKALRSRYEKFIQTNNTNEIVSARTTDFDRTKASILLVLAGMFPPNPSDRLEPDLNWTPIPYHYKNWVDDLELNLPHFYCPNYNREYNEVLASNVVQDFVRQNKNTFEYIQQHAGKNVTKILDVFFIHQGLKALSSMNLTLPEWTQEIYPNSSQHIGLHQLKFESHTTVTKRLNGGRTMKALIENMQMRSNNATRACKKKIYLNSVHDNNVAALLSALDLLETMPSYGSTVLFELYSSADYEYTVKIFYMEDPYSNPVEKHIPSCGTVCSLGKFVNVTKPFIPRNIKDECTRNNK